MNFYSERCNRRVFNIQIVGLRHQKKQVCNAYEFRGKSIHEAASQALDHRHNNLEKKLYEQASVWAPPAFWGPWANVVAQFGVAGQNPNSHITKNNIYMTGLGSSPLIMRLGEAIGSLAVPLLASTLHQLLKISLLLEMLQRKFRYVVKV
jgi:hypothetical protein